jgi:hypothetical protein
MKNMMKSIAVSIVLILGLTINITAQEDATDTTVVETEVATGDAGVVDSGEAASLGANSTNPEKEEKVYSRRPFMDDACSVVFNYRYGFIH